MAPTIPVVSHTFLRILEVLLRHQADPRARDGSGRTPLHHARDAAVATVLLNSGAEVTAKDVHACSQRVGW